MTTCSSAGRSGSPGISSSGEPRRGPIRTPSGPRRRRRRTSRAGCSGCRSGRSPPVRERVGLQPHRAALRRRGGALACWWLRALGLARGAALVGGLVFALAPYRVGQSTGHLLGLIAFLLPAALLALERRRFVWAAIALTAIPLSGQIHLAMGAVVLALGYAWARVPRSDWWKAGAGGRRRSGDRGRGPAARRRRLDRGRRAVVRAGAALLRRARRTSSPAVSAPASRSSCSSAG